MSECVRIASAKANELATVLNQAIAADEDKRCASSFNFNLFRNFVIGTGFTY